MNIHRYSLLLIIVFFSLTSCLITDSVRSTRFEIMKPGVYGVPKNLSVALLKSDLLQSDTTNFQYSNGFKNLTDPTIKYQAISDTCVYALANYLIKEGYFREVINYSDSSNYLSKLTEQSTSMTDLFERTKSDVCIFLYLLNFDTFYITYSSVPFITHAKLRWTIAVKSDSTNQWHEQTDTLLYYKSQVHRYKDKKTILKQLVNNSCQYLGQSFGTKIIPSWVNVDRMYYRSNNHQMLLAEKHALSNNWVKAAELWNKETKNKNQMIAAKACYNMALYCEMQGKPEVGIDWLQESSDRLFHNCSEHKINCQQYMKVLKSRRDEIVLLSQQLGYPANNPITE